MESPNLYVLMNSDPITEKVNLLSRYTLRALSMER